MSTDNKLSVDDIFYDTICTQHNVGQAIVQLKGYAQQNSYGFMLDELTAIDDNYSRMCEFMLRGTVDEKRDDVYNGLLKQLYRLTASLRLMQYSGSRSSYGQCRYPASKVTLQHEAIKARLEAFVTDTAMLSLDGDASAESKRKQLYADHQAFVDELFCSILLMDQWNESQSQFAVSLLTSPLVDANDSMLLVSALMLSCSNIFDFYKFRTLVDIYRHSFDEKVCQRAFVGWVFSLPGAEGSVFPKFQKLIGELTADDKVCRELLELQMQVFFCLSADEDNARIQRDIMPGLMKGNGFHVTRFGIEENQEDTLQNILNPDAQDKAMEELERNMKKMADMQRAGVDIYFRGFSMMKRYPFFHTLSNWLCPFYPEHPGLATVTERMQGLKFLGQLFEHGPFCDSDKYSFAISLSSVIDRIPANVREMMNGGEVMMMPMASEENGKPAYIRRMYLQDLYRFYRLYDYRADFRNPFDYSGEGRSRNFFFINVYLRAALAGKKAWTLGNFLLKRRQMDALWHLLDVYGDAHSAEYHMLAGYAAQRRQDAEAAYVHFSKAADGQPGNTEVLKCLAQQSFNTRRFGEAEALYNRLSLQCPDDTNIQISWAISMIENGKVPEGMNELYRLDLTHPGIAAIQRGLAWGHLLQKNPDKAYTLYEKLLQMAHPMADDYLNAGYCLWFQRRLSQAVESFKAFVKGRGDTPEGMAVMSRTFASDAELLKLYGISATEQTIMADLVERA